MTVVWTCWKTGRWWFRTLGRRTRESTSVWPKTWQGRSRPHRSHCGILEPPVSVRFWSQPLFITDNLLTKIQIWQMWICTFRWNVSNPRSWIHNLSYLFGLVPLWTVLCKLVWVYRVYVKKQYSIFFFFPWGVCARSDRGYLQSSTGQITGMSHWPVSKACWLSCEIFPPRGSLPGDG